MTISDVPSIVLQLQSKQPAEQEKAAKALAELTDANHADVRAAVAAAGAIPALVEALPLRWAAGALANLAAHDSSQQAAINRLSGRRVRPLVALLGREPALKEVAI